MKLLLALLMIVLCCACSEPDVPDQEEDQTSVPVEWSDTIINYSPNKIMADQ